MTPRLTSSMLVSALIRRVAAEGGNASVLAKGDTTAGSVLVICAERGAVTSIQQRVLGLDGRYEWQAASVAMKDDNLDYEGYLNRQRQRDPDLWLIELDIANAERFAAETTGEG